MKSSTSMKNSIVPEGQPCQTPSIDLRYTLGKVIRRCVSQIAHCFCAASLITCGMLFVALCFRFNPYLSNANYQKDPQANMMNLLISTVPPCSIVFMILLFLITASYLLGCFDLKKNIISTKHAILIVFTNRLTYLTILFPATIYPCLLLLFDQLLEWDNFKTFSIQILCLMAVICLATWFCFVIASLIFSTQLLRPEHKALSDSLIIFGRHGIMKKKAKRKVLILRRVRTSFILSLPLLMLGLFICLFAITTRYCLHQSNTFMSFYCLSIVTVKIFLQWLLRRYLISLSISKSGYYAYISILVCTVLLDCVVRFVFSQLKSSADFILLTVSLGIIEVCTRCFSVFIAIGMTKNTTKNLHCKETEAICSYTQKAKTYATLIIIKIEAGVVSEYVAINSTFVMNCFFGNYIGFIVGKNGSFEIEKQIMYLACQYFIEIIVDFVAFAMETFHPELEEIMAEQSPQSHLGKISTSLTIGTCCMLILIMLVVD